MSDFAGMEDLLQDFLQEANDLLSDVDNKLVDLEKNPDDRGLLNDIFRGFHTVKGGAGFLNATELVTLCHLTENLFDRLRNGDLELSMELMDTIMAATKGVRDMFGELAQGVQPSPAAPEVLAALEGALQGKTVTPHLFTMTPAAPPDMAAGVPPPGVAAVAPSVQGSGNAATAGPDWQAFHAAVTGQPLPVPPAATPPANPSAASPVAAQPVPSAQPAAPQQASQTFTAPQAGPASPQPVAATPVRVAAEPEVITRAEVMAQAAQQQTLPATQATINSAIGRRASDRPGAANAPTGRRMEERVRENTIRVDTSRLDQVLNLSGEIGLTKNRLTSLRADIIAGKTDAETLHALDQAVSQLDLLVSDLQNSVMKTRMQPIGRLFQKYPRIARDLARQLGKDVELVLAGEETEVDKTMIEDLADPLIHLIRNAVDHGVETPGERAASGKPAKSLVRLEARQEGDHIVLIVADDGRGMTAERIRAKAVEKGLVSEEEANTLDERQSFNLIFLPGFSTKSQISDVSGRGVGMDVVKTNIQKLNGSIEIRSEPGKGSVFIISLPLTLAILPVLLVLLGDQPFALPLSLVREILPIERDKLQEVGGKETLVVRGEILPLVSLSSLLGWPMERPAEYGVLMQTAERSFILGVDSFAGRDDAVIKSLEDFRPRGVAGVTTLSNGQIVLILDMKELLADAHHLDDSRTLRALDFS